MAMEDLVAKGLVRSIGVSNFSGKRLRAMRAYATIFPAVNQVELHPQWRQDGLLKDCAELGVHVTAYSPLGSPGTNSAAAIANIVPPRGALIGLSRVQIEI
jgi:diketogulonate reductase-like aldo/keto reductase